jgi:multicomponent Na+:H+ antiporter subunit E
MRRSSGAFPFAYADSEVGRPAGDAGEGEREAVPDETRCVTVADPPLSHTRAPRIGARVLGRRVLALGCWCYVVWLLLTATLTLEQLTVGAAVSLAVGCALAPLGEVAGPWRLLRPRVVVALAGLGLTAATRVVVANVRLAHRVWSPSRPLASGMVVVATHERSDAGVTAVGLVTSSIVDNQLVDVDMRRARLQYHAVDVAGIAVHDPERARSSINAPIERRLAVFRRGDDA